MFDTILASDFFVEGSMDKGEEKADHAAWSRFFCRLGSKIIVLFRGPDQRRACATREQVQRALKAHSADFAELAVICCSWSQLRQLKPLDWKTDTGVRGLTTDMANRFIALDAESKEADYDIDLLVLHGCVSIVLHRALVVVLRSTCSLIFELIK